MNSDADFLDAFESCSLPEEQWTHRAHVRMAWIYLHRGSLAETIPRVREGIKRYNASLKKTLAYHETITLAFLHVIDHRIRLGDAQLSFEEFCDSNPDLLDRTMPVLLKHYRKERLFSDLARQTFIQPDLLDFPS